MRIGIIGYGVVGKATHNSLPDIHEVSISDPDLGYYFDNENFMDAIFICVPTPTRHGKQDLSIFHTVLDMLDRKHYEGLVIIKSTILPNTELNPGLDTIVSPEFLDQNKPYFEQDKHLIGVENIYQKRIYEKIFPDAVIRTTDIPTAMMAKYVHNCYGAVKVTFFNEMKSVCDVHGVDYREMMGAMLGQTDHISRTYTRMSVDGSRGFGGACFPKDTVAFNTFCYSNVLRGAIHTNHLFRKREMKEVTGEDMHIMQEDEENKWVP